MAWQQLVFETDEAGAEPLEALLEAAGAAAVSLEDSADQPLYEPPPGATPLWRATRVIALFEADHDVQSVLDELGTHYPNGLPHWRLEPLEEREWTRAWMDDYRPMRFGERLWIVPSWSAPPEPDAVNLLLDPGLAFGTGTHPTTRLCLEWLDAHPPRAAQVLDYGCGSGILAIAAALLGAAHVWAIDNDPQALIATRDNAARNGVDAQIHAALPERMPALECDLLIANILAGPLIDLAPQLAPRVRAGGDLVLSGILPEQAAEVAAAWQPWFDMDAPHAHEGWVRLAGRRR